MSEWNSFLDSELLPGRDWYFQYYSSNDHDFFYQVQETQIFLELICSQVIIQETTFGTRFDYYEFLIVFSEDQLLTVFLDLVNHVLAQGYNHPFLVCFDDYKTY